MTSWVDRIAGPEGWLSRVRWWVWIPAAWVLLTAIMQSPLWIVGRYEFGTFSRVALTDPFYLVAPLAGYHLLTTTARAAFDRFRPALAEDHPIDGRHRLSSSPMVPATIGLVIGGVVGTAIYFSDPNYSEVVDASALSSIVWGVASFISFGMHVVLATLVVRQLILVSRLHRQATQIDLFRPGPVHAFATLTARAGIVVLILAVYSATTDPTTFTNPAWRVVFAVATALSAAAFFLPLSGLARRLRAEKRDLLDTVAGRMTALRSSLYAAVDRNALDELGNLRTAMAALGEDQDRIGKVSPWPWETATLRGFATTLLIPITGSGSV